MWEPREVELGAFLDGYCLRRYGVEGALALRRAHDHLVASVYSAKRPGEPYYCFRPLSAYDRFDPDNPFAWTSIGAIRSQAEHLPELIEAVRAALAAPATVHGDPLYRKDLVDMGRMVVALLYNQHYLRLLAAYARWDRDDFAKSAERLRGLLRLQERLLHSEPWFRLQRTIDETARLPLFGGEEGAPRAVRARHMWVSNGGKTSIHLLDYYRQDRYELVRDYYSVRVRRFLEILSEQMEREPAPLPVERLKAAYESVESA